MVHERCASSSWLQAPTNWAGGRTILAGGALADVIAPPPGELFSETNDNSVAILLSYGTARILLAGDAEAREEEYMANGPYTGLLTMVNIPKLHTL